MAAPVSELLGLLGATFVVCGTLLQLRIALREAHRDRLAHALLDQLGAMGFFAFMRQAVRGAKGASNRKLLDAFRERAESQVDEPLSDDRGANVMLRDVSGKVAFTHASEALDVARGWFWMLAGAMFLWAAAIWMTVRAMMGA